MKTKLVGCILLLGIFQMAFAYPIPSRNLRELITESKYIVYAKVAKIEKVVSEKSWQNSIATLEIEELLQGEIKSKTIEVNFTPNMMCPAPAVYIEGRFVLAFLDKTKNAYSTHALSYGTKYFDSNKYTIYKNRILEYQCIHELDNEEVKYKESLEWMIKCIMDSSTRQEGISELDSNKNLGFEKEYNDGIKLRLNPEQKSKLRTELFTAQQLNYRDYQLIPFLIEDNDVELQELLFNELNSAKNQRIAYPASAIMTWLAEMTNRAYLKKLVAEIPELDFQKLFERKETIEAIRLKFIEQY